MTVRKNFKETLKIYIRDEKWLNIIHDILKDHQDIFEQLREEKVKYLIYPHQSIIFRAFNECSFDDLKVVILGQDPYYTPGVADGLAFSTKADRCPPSLLNIKKELESDVYGGLNLSLYQSNDLTPWARQGVLLLNTALTVRHLEPETHIDIWKPFTIKLLQRISEEKNNIVFLLWGKKAQSYTPYINNIKHEIFMSGHPSPLSVNHFMGCRHFSKTNGFLKWMDLEPIDWNLVK